MVYTGTSQPFCLARTVSKSQYAPLTMRMVMGSSSERAHSTMSRTSSSVQVR